MKVKAQAGFSQKHFSIAGVIPDNQVKSIAKDHNGFYWVLSNAGWLTRWNGNDFLPMNPAGNTLYQDILYDQSGHVYFLRPDSGYDYADRESRLMPLPEDLRKEVPMNIMGGLPYLDKTWEEIAGLNIPYLFHRFKAGFQQSPPFQYFISKNERYQFYDWNSSDTAYHYLNGIITPVFIHKALSKKVFVVNDCLVVIYNLDSFLIYRQGRLVNEGRDTSLRQLDGVIKGHQQNRNVVFVNIGGIIYRLSLQDDRLVVNKFPDQTLVKFIPGGFYYDEINGLLFILDQTGGFTLYGSKPIQVIKKYKESEKAVSYTVYKKDEKLFTNTDFQMHAGLATIEYNHVAPILRTGSGDFFYPSESLMLLCDQELRIKRKWKTKGGITRSAVQIGDVIYIGKDIILAFDSRSNTISRFEPNPAIGPDERIVFIARGSKSDLLVATNRELFTLDPITRKRRFITRAFAGKDIRSLAWDAELGMLLVTVKPEGIFCLDPEGKQIKLLPVGEQFSLLSAHYLLKDKEGDYWVPTNNGLYLMKQIDLRHYLKDSTRNIPYFFFGPDHGIENPEFNGGFSGCGMMDGDSIFMGSMGGVVSFAPAAIKRTVNVGSGSRILLNGVWVDDSLFRAGTLIRLPPDFKRCLFRFDFAMINTPSLKLEYQLEGVRDNAWFPLSRQSEVMLRGLSAGTYILTVRVSNQPEIKPLSFKIIVSQYWYKTWWAYTSYFLAAGILIMLIANWRIQRVRNRSLTEIDKNRRELFTIISHDLRTPLKAYQGLGDTISYLLKNEEYERVQKVADQIDSTGIKLDMLMDNLLNWNLLQQEKLSTHDEELDLPALVMEHTSIYEDIAALKGNRILVSAGETIRINADRDMVSLMIRNLLDNAIKNSPQQRDIIVRVTSAEKGEIELSVTNAVKGNGLEKLQWLSQQLERDAELETSSKNSGIGLRMIQLAAKKTGAKLKIRADSENAA
ncbi:MAG: GHKL domain-containing protein, partial [Chitinophagaceae bacterium]|nr:GHKL domain-containing protein [Chitinophagaceae bacterium]